MKAITILTLFILVLSFSGISQEFNRDASTNLLMIEVEGGDQGFRDETYIHFDENATTGYDEEIDAVKWLSIDPEATMIWTIASDYTDLAINNLPLFDLRMTLNSVPLQFTCGYGGGTYSLIFSELDTFEEGIEIWLEDLQNEGDWTRITEEENTYTFEGIPGEDIDRFKIHILDPLLTDVYQPELQKEVTIYASGSNIFIRNMESKYMQQVHIYNLSGKEIPLKNRTASQEGFALHIQQPTGYYIVRVALEGEVYSEKVYVMN